MAATMAAEDNEDQWLYGSSNPPPPEDTPMTESFSAGNGGKIGDIDGVNPVSMTWSTDILKQSCCGQVRQ